MSLADRFWSKADRSDGCWEWTAATSRGYGSFNDEALPTHRAHRIAWLLSYGPIPPGMDVCHSCDNRLCVRPDHLWLGTRGDNNRDMVQKGRYRLGRRHVGEANGSSVLTWEQVADIRRLHAEGVSQRELARRFPVSRPRIRLIVTGQAWVAP